MDRAVRVTAPVPEDVIAETTNTLSASLRFTLATSGARSETAVTKAVTHVTSVIQSLLSLLPYLLTASK
jgi:hypothetical protein